MRLRLIRLLAVVIALVVPLQGMAVVIAAQCMAFGHHEATAGHDRHDHDSHSHAEDKTSTVQSAENDGDRAHCGPCTACCGSASIAGPAGVSILSSLSSATYVFWQFPPISAQAHGLDRPPLAL